MTSDALGRDTHPDTNPRQIIKKSDNGNRILNNIRESDGTGCLDVSSVISTYLSHKKIG